MLCSATVVFVKVSAGECAALWPRIEHENKTLRAKVAGQPEKTAAFIYTDSHTTLLKLDNKVMQGPSLEKISFLIILFLH